MQNSPAWRLSRDAFPKDLDSSTDQSIVILWVGNIIARGPKINAPTGDFIGGNDYPIHYPPHLQCNLGGYDRHDHELRPGCQTFCLGVVTFWWAVSPAKNDIITATVYGEIPNHQYGLNCTPRGEHPFIYVLGHTIPTYLFPLSPPFAAPSSSSPTPPFPSCVCCPPSRCEWGGTYGL